MWTSHSVLGDSVFKLSLLECVGNICLSQRWAANNKVKTLAESMHMHDPSLSQQTCSMRILCSILYVWNAMALLPCCPMPQHPHIKYAIQIETAEKKSSNSTHVSKITASHYYAANIYLLMAEECMCMRLVWPSKVTTRQYYAAYLTILNNINTSSSSPTLQYSLKHNFLYSNLQ